MGDHVKITKNGFLDVSWNGETKEYEERERETYVPALRQRCVIDEGVTLKDLFAAVEKDEILKDFISMYSWCSHIDEFLAQIKETPPEPDRSEKLFYLEIYWHAEAFTYRKKDLKPSFDAYVGFHAWGEPDEYAQKRGDDKTCYGVSYTPMYYLADLPIKLNEEIEITHTEQKNKRDFQDTVLFKGESCFSLLEVLDAIFDDISWHGGPAGNAAFVEEMKERVEEIKDGRAETVPWEDLFPDEQEGE
jgi:hypothetical protein